MSNIQLQVKANLYKTALEKVTGIPVQAEISGNKARLYWTKENAFLLRNYLNSMLDRKPAQSDIDIQIEPAIRPLYIDRLGPYVVILLALGLATGIILGKHL